MTQAISSKSNQGFYILFLGIIAAVPALSTDMYLPAMPTIARQWNISEAAVSLSLVLWFVSFSIFLLVYGPLSDKYGRRPILLGGLSLFMIAGFLCALSANVYQLIAFRILQGIGAAAPSAMCMAICRDRYEGDLRKRILAYISIILSLTPMIAPTIGSILLKFTTWRVIFIMQGMLTVGTIFITLNYKETLANPLTENIIHLYGRYRKLFRNRNYLLCNNAIGIIAGPFYGYLGLSSIVYISLFHLSEQAFSLLFGLNAMISMCGAFLSTRLTKYVSDVRILTACFLGYAISGVGIMLTGHLHYLCFAAFMGGISFCLGMSRPLSNHLVLEQVSEDIGSASSFLVFYQFIIGAICMAIATADWQRPILAFGVQTVIVAAVVLLLWPVLLVRLHLVGINAEPADQQRAEQPMV
jgi:DHA1 family bicyclomycin/chloramphenicol resistance-like MFS transporter